MPVPSPHPDYRFTLANERTLLAWLRTGLALVATGLGTAVAGYLHWRGNEAAIASDEPLPESRLAPAVFGTVGTVLVIVAVLVGIQVASQ